MTRNDLLDIGFHFDQRYEHDHFITDRYSNGVIHLEFTMDTKTHIETYDVFIDDVSGIVPDLDQLNFLVKVLNTDEGVK